MSRRLATLVVTVAGAAALTACGSGHGTPGERSGSGYASDIRFADCMRSHGVTNFPDPLPTGGFPRSSGGSQSPAARAARRTCFPILRPGGNSHHTPSRAQLAAALSYARCMRGHGVPDFPDPVTTLANRNINVIDDAGIIFPVGSSIDPGSPAFRHADQTCGGRPGGQPKGG